MKENQDLKKLLCEMSDVLVLGEQKPTKATDLSLPERVIVPTESTLAALANQDDKTKILIAFNFLPVCVSLFLSHFSQALFIFLFPLLNSFLYLSQDTSLSVLYLARIFYIFFSFFFSYFLLSMLLACPPLILKIALLYDSE